MIDLLITEGYGQVLVVSTLLGLSVTNKSYLWCVCLWVSAVTDTIKPIITGLQPLQPVQCSAVPRSNVSATDNDPCFNPAKDLSFQEVFTPGRCKGTYNVTRTWTARDLAGNTASAILVVQVSVFPDHTVT